MNEINGDLFVVGMKNKNYQNSWKQKNLLHCLAIELKISKVVAKTTVPQFI